jgi:proton-dependent oligopeptide transporter, POT family
MSDKPVTSDPNYDASWFGHPKQLARLFTTEMWERFGYYGMRALLTLYLVEYFFFKDEVSAGLYGAFTSLVYLTPLFGGLIADRYLGYKKSVKLGAVLMACGYIGLCFGNHRADPVAIIKNQTYVIDIREEPSKTEGSNESATVRYIKMEGQEYRIAPQKDASIKLISTTGDSTKDIEVAKGEYNFDGVRNPFWLHLMFISLSAVIVGNGFFKPNISTIVGSLYSPGDHRRDGGFTIFYMGINLGSTFSQLLCPLLYEVVGPWAGFALAGGGMILAWFLFQFDGGRLRGYGEPPADSTLKRDWTIYICAAIAIPMIWWLLNNTMVAAQAAADASKVGEESVGIWAYLMGLPVLGKIMFIAFTLSMVGIPLFAFIKGSVVEAQRMLVATVLVFFSVVFWTLFEQAGSSLTLYASRNTNLNIFGYKMPAGQTQSFNAIFIVLFAPVFTMLWNALGRRNMEPSTPVKFAVSLILVGLGFLALVFGSRFADDQYLVPLSWLALAYLIHSIGELCLSPVGLSMITKLSMAKVVGLMMGVWFLSSAVAQYVGGIIAQLASVTTVGGEVTDPEKSLATYVGVFELIGYWGCGIGVGLLVLSPLLKKMMHGIK